MEYIFSVGPVILKVVPANNVLEDHKYRKMTSFKVKVITHSRYSYWFGQNVQTKKKKIYRRTDLGLLLRLRSLSKCLDSLTVIIACNQQPLHRG